MLEVMEIRSPLTGKTNVSFVESIDVAELTKAYNKNLGIDITSEVKDVKEVNLYRCKDTDLLFFYPSLTGSGLFYQKLQNFPWYYSDYKYEFYFVKKLIKSSDSVLEIGCGNCAFAKIIDVKEYVGLELNEKAQQLAVSKGFNVLRESLEEHSKHRNQHYDVVCSFQVLEHIENVYSFIEASITCLKKDGLLVFSVPNNDSFLSLLTNDILNMPPHHITRWSNKSLKFVAECFDLELVTIEQEKLANIHKRQYISTIIVNRIRKFFNLPNKLVDNSFSYKIMYKLSVLFSQVLEPGLNDDRLMPNGHSVTAVYRRRN
jgi:2-polyprenyl-3-methyl-5-hydroxy-6-metoxy-1,4-benzoquinol methylase